MKFSSKTLLILLFVAFFLIRIIFLTADSPLWLSWSTAPFTDESSKAFHIRNLLLFGEKDVTQLSHLCNDCVFQTAVIIDNPIVNAPLILFMNWFGVNYFAIRLISVVFGLLSLLVFFFLVKEFFDDKTALLATALLGFNFVFLMENRLALLETPVAFFIILCVFFWAKSLKNNFYIFSVLSAFAFSAALLYKPIAIAFVPVIIAMIALSFWKNKEAKKSIIQLFLFLFSFALFVFFTPDFSVLGDVTSYQGAQGIGDIARTASIFFINRMFIQMPVMLAIAFVFAFYVIIKLLQKKQFNELEIISMVWFFSFWVFFSLRAYQPPRYLVAMIPAISILCAVFLVKLMQLKNSKEIISANNLLSRIVLFFVFIVSAFGISLYLNKFFLARDSLAETTYFTAVFAPIILILLIIFYFVWKKLIQMKLTNFFFRNLAVVLLVLILLNSFIPFFLWLSSPQYSIQNTTAEIRELGNPRIIGLWGESLCFETKFKCFAGADGTNLETVFTQLKPSHILIGRDARDLETIQKYNEYESIDVEKINSFIVGGRTVDLYEVEYVN
ncbi:MAG: glycosyltransferase family 39 protein [archaeon]|nr:glycosyltransferase family 39 protein [archaeon]